MRKIRIAQIGIGHDHASAIINTLRKQSDIYEIVGYAVPEVEQNRFENNLKSFEGIPELSVDEILNDPTIEAVAIETEEVNLTNYALMAAKAGKHIHMDKPGGLELAQFEELIRVLKEKKLAFSLGYMYRFNSAIMELMEDIKAGKLGQIVSVEAHMSCWHGPNKRQWLEAFPGGMLFFLGCHLIDLVYGIMGQPDEVIPMSYCSGVDGVTAQDCGMAILRYQNNVSFVKSCALERGGFDRRQLVVTGSKGTVELRPLEMYGNFENQYTGVRTSTSTVWADRGYTTNTKPRARYAAMMESFYETAVGLKENPYSYDYELAVYKLVLQCCGVKVS